MTGRFDIIATALEGLQVLVRKPVGDQRGYLERLFCARELQVLTANRPVVQINHTHTKYRGTMRGMHFQYPPHAEIKFVSCLRGEVFDVAVDLRRGSETFLHWHGEILSAGNHRTLCIPEGFAHGFQTLADECEMLYLHTAAYAPDNEGGLNARDPALAIDWPLPVAVLSDRDAGFPLLDASFQGIVS